MDNKLSELNKPVTVDPVTVETVRERLSFLDDLNARGVGTAVRSQQFEIACLRELLAAEQHAAALLEDKERLASDLVARNGEIEGLRERAAELESYNVRLREWNAGLAQESCELQAKLATPVRLPPLMDGELCGKYGAKYGAAAIAHNNAITACSIAIRGAGFKSEETALKCVGDE